MWWWRCTLIFLWTEVLWHVQSPALALFALYPRVPLSHICVWGRVPFDVCTWCWHSGVKAYRALGEIWGSDIYHLIPGNLVDFFVSWWLFEKLSLYFSVSIENKQRQAWCLVRPRDHLEALILVVLVSCLSPVQTTCVWICNLLLYTNLPVPVIKCANMDLFCSQGGDET